MLPMEWKRYKERLRKSGIRACDQIGKYRVRGIILHFWRWRQHPQLDGHESQSKVQMTVKDRKRPTLQSVRPRELDCDLMTEQWVLRFWVFAVSMKASKITRSYDRVSMHPRFNTRGKYNMKGGKRKEQHGGRVSRCSCSKTLTFQKLRKGRNA